jgi:hypothetical protein
MFIVSSRRSLGAVIAALACAAVFAIAVPADARTKAITLPYSGTFAAPTVISTQPLIAFTTDHLVVKESSLGPFTGVYPHYVNFDAGTFSGVAVFTAASGDRLVMHLGGSGTPTSPTTFAVTLAGRILGGSGRFDHASGALTGSGTVDLAGLTVAATLAGTIEINDSDDR